MRTCLKCHADLTDVMGCYVFTVDDKGELKAARGLVCVNHGVNHGNVFSVEEYRRLTAA